jgi:hypothetical protein
LKASSLAIVNAAADEEGNTQQAEDRRQEPASA